MSLWINNPDLTKKLSIPIATAFLIYDIFVGSYMGMINESISILSIIIYFIRKYKEEKRNAKKYKEEKQNAKQSVQR